MDWYRIVVKYKTKSIINLIICMADYLVSFTRIESEKLALKWVN